MVGERSTKSLITQLTAEQALMLPEFRDQWFRIGTCTDRADRQKAEAAILAMRAEINVSTKPIFIWCASPATSLLALHYLKSPQFKEFVKKIAESELPMGVQLRPPSPLGDSLRDSPAWWGQHEAYWISFYVFCRDVLGVEYDERRSRQLDTWQDIAQSCCWWWCYENYVVVSDRPTIVSMEPNGRGSERLHCEAGPAIAFADGWEVYALHGVRVSKEIVTTPADKLDPQLLLKEINAEVRREILRKIGVERAIASLGAKVIDKFGDYELLEVDFSGTPRRYLKMRNPSIGVWHVEPVGPECTTIECVYGRDTEALHWRKPDAMRAIPVSVDGEEWQQQGDVYIWPIGAAALKPLPQVLT